MPSHQQLLQSYQAADLLDSALKKVAVVNRIKPNWAPAGNGFWYAKALNNNDVSYLFVNASTGDKRQLFETQRLREALEKLTGLSQKERFWITDMFTGDQDRSITFKVNDKWFYCDLKSYKCMPATDTTMKHYDPEAPLQTRRYRWEEWTTDSASADKKRVAYIKNGNIYIKSLLNQAEVQLTTDGTTDKPWGNVTWSPDNSHVVAYRIDPRKSKNVYYVLSSVPGTTRGELKSHEYDQPGDEFTTYQQYLFNVDTRTKIKTETDKIDFFGAPVLHWRKGNSRYFTFEKADRGHQRFRVIQVDVTTGATRNIIDEKTKTFIYEQRIYTYYCPDTHEIVWITEKDGWRHIYLVDELTGKEKLVTTGNWVVRDIDSVDTKKRMIWFKGSGKNAAENPYNMHFYQIGFDGKNLVDLTPEKGNHQLSYSPYRKYFIDTYSEVNTAPVIVLKRMGAPKAVHMLEHSPVNDLLATGIKLPEVFVAKARDGKTDIWGVVYRPANMDPAKAYPVIENIYAGPQDSFVPKSFSVINEMQSIAQLGFIVVQIDGMGTANRSKAFHDVCWHNLADAGFEDRILWMKALAAKYPQVDIARVGVYGTSAGGQNSAGALLFHPEFYKSAVSACGCHDNRIDKQWWNEQWMGYPVGPHYEAQSNITNAGKLTGNLLLIVGEADNNVPPESTFRFADALIKNNKMFDLLVVPGMGHSDGGKYGRLKKRDFFVKHLLQADPPERNRGEKAVL
ncbi:S9 family peptidase [Mucilaginibacter phyllosphaerae]|nr:S9 family peptidase [Mucilaginibacter phyllosphaerae]MBB3969496.1 dipeptidyl aminopeptidase/acylaminoacyl peptidase [Mucilaginibacter phyllosphaerae]GGH08973.1 peptidase [Mucilaginibacter phyllosphaerae]